MNKNLIKVSIRTSFLLTFILLINVSGIAQKKRVVTPKKTIETNKVVETIVPEKRPVTVNLKEGEPLKGTFVNATSDGVQILIAGNTLTLKWNDISQIVFTDVISNESVTKNASETKSNEAVENALKLLRKLAAATEVLSWGKRDDYKEFGRRFIDVKAEVNEVLPEIPDGNVKDEIKKAMEAYDDTMIAWNYMFGGNSTGRTTGDLLPDYEPGKTLQQKYSIPTYSSGSLNLMGGDKVINTIWQAARIHIENASKGDPNKETK